MSTIEVKNLVLYKKNQQKHGKRLIPLIKNLETSFESGKINAIMGPNGSSKTTFLDILYGMCDQSTETSGSILYNGKEREAGEWFSTVSYSEQDCTMMHDCTVLEAIQFSMGMCDGTKEYVDELIKNLHLKKVADTKIGVISGGERKRAMMAISMIMGRKILILDEPTSDLDSHLAYNVTKYLKDLAIREDLMVIMTVHQPSPKLFETFDNFLFMYDGMCIYSGPVSGVVETMASKGIVQPNSWTTAEFLFEAFGDVSSFEEVEALRPHINSYIRELGISWQQNNAKMCKENEAMHYGRIRSKHVWLLAKRQFLTDLMSKYTLSRTFSISIMIMSFIYSMLSKEIELPSEAAGTNVPVQNPLRSTNPVVLMLQTIRLFPFFEFLKILYFSMDASMMFVHKPQMLKEISKNLYSPLELCISTIIVEVVCNLIVAVIMLAGIFIMSPGIVTVHIAVMILGQAIFLVLTTLLMRLIQDRITKTNAILGKIFGIVKVFSAVISFCATISILLISFLPRVRIMVQILLWTIISLCPAHLTDLFAMTTVKTKVVDLASDRNISLPADSFISMPSEMIANVMEWSSLHSKWLLRGIPASLILTTVLMMMLFSLCFSPSVRLRMSKE